MFTQKDNSFAELLIGETKLQNLLLIEIVDYLSKVKSSTEVKENTKDSGQIHEKKGNPYGDYGDEYGDDADNMENMYGDEYGGMDDFGDIDAYGIDLNDENLDANT